MINLLPLSKLNVQQWYSFSLNMHAFLVNFFYKEWFDVKRKKNCLLMLLFWCWSVNVMFWHTKTKVRKKCCKRLFLPRRFHWHVISCDCQTQLALDYSAILRLGNSRITKTMYLDYINDIISAKINWKKKKGKLCDW